MTYDSVKQLNSGEFKRLCGVKPETFRQMVALLDQAAQQKQPGRPSKLSQEDQLLLRLEYWREYRTYFHIAQSWGIHESTAYRIIRQVENTLISSRSFNLPGKKKLLEPDHETEVVVVDVTESPIERPQKNKNNSTVA
jgi:hypothetical protein